MNVPFLPHFGVCIFIRLRRLLDPYETSVLSEVRCLAWSVLFVFSYLTERVELLESGETFCGGVW